MQDSVEPILPEWVPFLLGNIIMRIKWVTIIFGASLSHLKQKQESSNTAIVWFQSLVFFDSVVIFANTVVP